MRDVSVLSTTKGIDLTAAAQTTLYTVPAGTEAVITKAVVRLTAAAGAGGPAQVSIGVGGDWDNIFPQTGIGMLATVGDAYIFDAEAVIHVATAGDEIKFDVDSASGKTTFDVDVDLVGYLR